VVVNGRKIFTTHGPDADFFVVWARFGDSAGEFGAVIVDREAPGFSVDGSHSFLSGEHYGMLFLDDCKLPKSRVLVDSDGFRRLFAVFNIERLGNASRSLALGQAALDLAVAHAKQRRQFGKPLADFQGLQWRMAEMALKLEGARLLLYRAAANADQGLPSQRETAIAKLACNRAGFEVADAAMQIFGGHGYDAESVVSYLFSRTRGWLIAGGTSEQMLDRIAKGLLKEREHPESGRSSP
jgi:alkylation response protein AidB-like acyl-CoA dehydrogenase